MAECAVDQPLLSLHQIVKRFGGNLAVDHVSLDIYPGQIVALLGENGAGKSTLIKILAGVYPRDSGEILFRGIPVESAASLHKGNEQPIAFIHQDPALVEWMTVAENMAMVMGFPRRYGLIDWQATRRQARAALDAIGIQLDPDERVFDLSRTEKSLLAIARAVAVDAEVLVLDEPTASLPADDVRHLFRVMNILRQKKVGMIYITHRLDEVLEMADSVCAMRDGRFAGGGPIGNYTLRSLVALIVGNTLGDDQRRPLPGPSAPVCLELDNLCVGDTGPVSFRLQAGEMLALAGLRGAGQEDIGRLLFGCRQPRQGSITLNGQPYRPVSPARAMSAGVSFVAGDRLLESLVPGMSVSENLVLNPVHHGYHRLGRYDKHTESPASQIKITRFDIRPARADIEISALSGGNQQKVVMARWLSLNAPLLILEDPSAGVDVGARAEIYDLLNQALSNGVAIMVISNDLEEVAHICNRALVFNRGKIAGELHHEDVSFARLLELASGSATAH